MVTIKVIKNIITSDFANLYIYTHLQILFRRLTVIDNNIFLRSKTSMANKGTKFLLDKSVTPQLYPTGYLI